MRGLFHCQTANCDDEIGIVLPRVAESRDINATRNDPNPLAREAKGFENTPEMTRSAHETGRIPSELPIGMSD